MPRHRSDVQPIILCDVSLERRTPFRSYVTFRSCTHTVNGVARVPGRHRRVAHVPNFLLWMALFASLWVTNYFSGNQKVTGHVDVTGPKTAFPFVFRGKKGGEKAL